MTMKSDHNKISVPNRTVKASHPGLIYAGYSYNNSIRLVRAGSDYFDLLESLIHAAKHTIHLQTYILVEDETGKRIIDALIQAARRGVQVYMLADGYASQDLSASFIKGLKSSGIHFRFFSPVLKSKYFYFGRRMHHKVVVVDSYFSLVGGINIGNHYNDTSENVAWLDWALYCEGYTSIELELICKARVKQMEKVAVNGNQQDQLPMEYSGRFLVRPRVNDWVRRKKQVTDSYLEMLTYARSHVVILSSYFLPGKELRKQLSKAAKRGVKITVILAGISDVPVAKHAERYMYRWMLRNHIEIYEYQRRVLHAKLATYDGKWVTIGSYNVNNISAYASVELNVDILNAGFAVDVESRLNRIIKTDCVQITRETYRQNQTVVNQFIQRSAYDIFRAVLFLFTFYFKQRD
jgi:cardiolipin synthase A/B